MNAYHSHSTGMSNTMPMIGLSDTIQAPHTWLEILCQRVSDFTGRFCGGRMALMVRILRIYLQHILSYQSEVREKDCSSVLIHVLLVRTTFQLNTGLKLFTQYLWLQQGLDIRDTLPGKYIGILKEGCFASCQSIFNYRIHFRSASVLRTPPSSGNRIRSADLFYRCFVRDTCHDITPAYIQQPQLCPFFTNYLYTHKYSPPSHHATLTSPSPMGPKAHPQPWHHHQ